MFFAPRLAIWSSVACHPLCRPRGRLRDMVDGVRHRKKRKIFGISWHTMESQLYDHCCLYIMMGCNGMLVVNVTISSYLSIYLSIYLYLYIIIQAYNGIAECNYKCAQHLNFVNNRKSTMGY